ncbi:hypothetical protein [Egicoccus halophilus]|uniref:Uncharacterized protein n=1 Tax=Egicoccus halophilus TaxID=1670830 RepID=A0A8J3EW94_9ACTN|nr:hypothetical protein [Egicoccus halophilus]GGI09850.1 hypothetical protein GCM10011354_36120 [Egicoccus halophilus]
MSGKRNKQTIGSLVAVEPTEEDVAASHPKWRSVGLIVAGLAFTYTAITMDDELVLRAIPALLAVVSFGLSVFWLIKYPKAPWF